MNSKIKKIMLLTTGLAGGLIATSVAGITLSSCTFQVQQDPNNSNNQGSSGSNNNSSNQVTSSPKDELTYNPNANYYTTQIVFDQSGNITNASAKTLTISDAGLIFADPAMTTLIGIMPNVEKGQITIPSTVKAITGYQAAVVYKPADGSIVNPTFKADQGGLVIPDDAQLLDLGAVGAFQKVGTIAPGAGAPAATPPSMTPATGLSTLTSIDFASGSQLQTIGPKAFAGCSKLTTVNNLPDTFSTIGAQAFQNCTNLQTINLKGVQYIGDAAFNNAFIASNNAIATSHPVSLNLSSAQYLGVGAFDSSIWTDATTRAAGDQVLPGTGNSNEQSQLSKISSVTFGSQLNTLSTYAFNGANYLTSADLSNCTNLAKVSDNAFRNTQNLASVKFSNTIDTIGANAFDGANILKSANFPSGLQTIGTAAFSGCPLTGSFNPESTTLDIGQNAFNGSAFDTIDFSKVTGNLTIGNSAFANNSALKSITWAKNEELKAGSQLQIKSQAFDGCTNLTLGTPGEGDAEGAPTTTPWALPNNLTLLANNAFPSSIKYESKYANPLQVSKDTLMSNSALGGVWNLFGSGDSNNVWKTNTLALGPQLFANNQNITSIDLSGSNIQALGYTKTSSISNVIGNTDFTIPTSTDNHTSTQLGTFANCTSLKTLTLPATCNQFGTGSSNYYWGSPFANCKSLANINYNGFDLTPVSEGANPVTAGFDQMNRTTWTQVANIMNAFGYVGQQKIGPDNNISVDPNAVDGTWTGTGGAQSEVGGSNSNNVHFYQSGMIGWYPKTTNSNYYWSNTPLSSYAAGSYTVTTTTNAGDPQTATTDYAAGLGATVDYGENVTAPGSTIEAPKKYTAGKQVQSAWYTLVAPTEDSAVPSAGLTGKYLTGTPATTGSGATAGQVTNLTSYPGNWDSGTTNNYSNFYTSAPVAESADAGSDENAKYIPIKMPANYNFQVLENGLDASTTVAFLNHNGVVWKYENKDGVIRITGTVNYYLGGGIQDQNNGVGGIDGVEGSIGANENVDYHVLTSVDPIVASGGSDTTFFGLDGSSSFTYSASTSAMLLFSQNGIDADGQPATISQQVGPKGLTVTLTLVPPTTPTNGK